MTKLFIATIVGCGLLMSIPAAAGTPAIADVNYVVQKEVPKKKTVKPKRQVVRLDFEKGSQKKVAAAPKPLAKKVVKSVAKVPKPAKKLVLKKQLAKKAVVKKQKAKKQIAKKQLKSKGVTLAQMKKDKRAYWSMHCQDGFVIKNHVYCSTMAQKPMPAKKRGVASSKNLEVKKRK